MASSFPSSAKLSSSSSSSSILTAAVLTAFLIILCASGYILIAFVTFQTSSLSSSHSSSSSFLTDIFYSRDSFNRHHALSPEGPVVDTPSGKIQGIFLDRLGKRVSAFLGIPYATPPTGSLRFSRPEPIIKWGKKPYQAVKQPPACLQFQSNTIDLPWVGDESVPESEDCLKLNIWTTRVNNNSGNNDTSSSLKPVLVWIHGGGFVAGHSRTKEFDGSILASFQDVIVVTFNYRVGIFGFLNLGDDDIQGNMGMFDQVLALKWIRSNVASFGGDPESITLFGESAGAASVGFHSMSPLSRNLFKRGIMQSGSPLMPIVLMSKEQEEIVTNDVLNLTGCFDASDVSHCLRYKSVSDLLAVQSVIIKRKDDTTFSPTFGDDFLPTNPFEGIRSGDSLGPQKEILMGYNRDEGSVFIYFAHPNKYPAVGHHNLSLQSNNQTNISMEIISDVAVKFMKTQNPSAIRTLMTSLYSDVLMSATSLSSNNYTEILFNETRINVGEFFIVCPTIFAAEELSRNNMSVYFYHFNHRPKNTPWAEWVGATHFEEVQFVFGVPLKNPEEYTREEIKLSKKMMKAWASFARNGVPVIQKNIDWTPYKLEKPAYLDISVKGNRLKMASPPQKRCSLWRLTFEVSRGQSAAFEGAAAESDDNDEGEEIDSSEGDDEGKESEKNDETSDRE